MNITRNSALVKLGSRPQPRPTLPETLNLSSRIPCKRHSSDQSVRVSTLFAYRSKRFVPRKATPSPKSTTREQVVTVVQVSPFIDGVVIPASVGVIAGYLGMAVAEVGQSFNDARVGVVFTLTVDVLLLLLFGVAAATIRYKQTEFSLPRSFTKTRSITVTESGKSVVMTVQPIVAICRDDISKFSPFLRERFKVSEQATIKATMQGGFQVDLHDQEKADISLSDFLQEAKFIVIECLQGD